MESMVTAEILPISFAAYRFNNYQIIRNNNPRKGQVSNRNLIECYYGRVHRSTDYMIYDRKFEVEDCDHESYADATKFFKKYSLYMLGDTLTNFQKTVYRYFNSETTSPREINLAAYFPQFIESEKLLEENRKLVKQVCTNNKYLGPIKGKINDVVKIIKRNEPSEYYSSYFYYGIIGDCFVSFNSKKLYEPNKIYNIRGRIKKLTTNYSYNSAETRLNYVTLIPIVEQ